MDHASRTLIQTSGRSESMRPPRRSRGLIAARLRFAFVAAAFTWGAIQLAVECAGVERPERRKSALVDDDADDLAPISRVTPRVKTILQKPEDGTEIFAEEDDEWAAESATEEQSAEYTEEAAIENSDEPASDNDGEFADGMPPPIDEEPKIRPRRRKKRRASSANAVRAGGGPRTAAARVEPVAEETVPVAAEDPPAPGLIADPAGIENQEFFADPALAGPEFFESEPPQVYDDRNNWGPIRKFLYFNQSSGDIGIGHERVMFAPFEIESSQPNNNIRLRLMSAWGLHSPDRAEYIWARIGGPGPPLPEKSVDYQDLRAVYEAGGKRFSFITEIPMRIMHPEINSGGSGLSNISLAPKTVLVDGKDWQISQVFRTYLPTGSTQRGTSNGHVALEPGVLVRYRWSPRLYIHGQTKYWIPLGGTPDFQGYVFNYGVGASYVFHETDAFAILPVLEIVGWTVGGGQQTLPTGMVVSATDDSWVNIQPGVRFVLGPKGDLGLCEFGI